MYVGVPPIFSAGRREILALIIDGRRKACLQLSLLEDYSHTFPVMSVTLEYSTVVTDVVLACFGLRGEKGKLRTYT